MLIADANMAHVDWLAGILAGEFEVTRVHDSARAVAALQGMSPHILIVGSKLNDMPGANLIAQLAQFEAHQNVAMMFLADPRSGAPIPQDDSLYYVLRPDMSTDDVHAIISSAIVGGNWSELQATPDQAARLQRMLEVPRQFALQRDLSGATRVATNALIEFLGADRADCLFYDHGSGSLWNEGEGEEKYQGGGRDLPARFGLAGFAARTGQPVCVARAKDDPRYHRDIDDPAGNGEERILVQPVAGSDGQIHAVVIAIRGARGEPFSAEDRSLVSWLASQIGPLTGQLALQLEAESVIEEAREQEQIFRQEAMNANASLTRRGDVVRVSPAWVSWLYWLLVALLASMVAFALIGRVNEYSAGPAIVVDSGLTDLTSPVAGNVVSVDIEPGAKVEAGQVLARLYSADEASQLTRVDGEWRTRLREYLAAPADLKVRSALGSLRAERERALERLTIRAKHAGTVSDVRVTPGQTVVPGQTLVSVARGEGELSVIALLPGGDRPLLRAGMPLRLQITGQRQATQELEVGSVSSEVVGPAEAAGLLGAQLADSVPVSGPVVVVRAKLASRTFEVDGESYQFHHGMQGLAEAQLRSESILATLIPALKEL